MTSLPCTGVILAGGDGRRMGGARKGLLEVRGERIVDRVARALATCTGELLLVANDPGAGEWVAGVRALPDVRPGNGSLGGLHAALSHVRGPVLVVAWDMPFVVPGVLLRLRAVGEEGGASIDAAVPRGPSGKAEPLCAYYTPSCLPVIERRLDAGDRRLRAALGELRVRYVDAAELASHGPADVLFANVNTSDDLARANARAGAVA